MKRLTIFCLAVLAVSSLFPLPTHDARFLNIEIAYRLNADGSWDKEYRHQVRLDTYYAVTRAFGETFIVYNPDFQKLEVLKAETTMADGRKVAAPDNAFNEVLPFAAHGFADFSGLREMVVTHTGLERGAVVDLHYRIRTRPGFLPVFSGREALVRDFPVDAYKLEIIVPAGRELRCRVFDSRALASLSETGAEKHYVFKFADLRPAAHEPQAPAQAEPFVVFSMAANWERALAMSGDPSQLPAALQAKIEKLQFQYPDRTDLLAALQKAVAVEVQNCPLGFEAAGWQYRPCERVATSNYGTRLEKALLLRAMLKKAGIATDLLAIAAAGAFAPEVPTPLQLGEFWLKVQDASGTAYLDPCSEQQEFFPYRLSGLDAWNLERKGLEKLPASDWNRNGVEISGMVLLDPAGASGALVVAARGIFNSYDEATADSAGFITGLLKKIVPVEKAEVGKLLALTRHEIRAEVTFNGKWLKETGSGYFSAGNVRLPGLVENMVILERRESPLALEAPFKISLQLDLQPAAGLKLEYFAPNVERRNELGHYVRGLVVESNGLLRFSATCGIGKGVVEPGEYNLLRELLLPYFTSDFWLVLKK